MNYQELLLIISDLAQERIYSLSQKTSHVILLLFVEAHNSFSIIETLPPSPPLTINLGSSLENNCPYYFVKWDKVI